MLFRETPLKGAYLIDLQKAEDARGYFARSFCLREFEQQGLAFTIAQINTSLSRQRGTLRGMHYQAPPMAEIKVVRCVRGALYDVILDLRPESPTFGQSFGAELSCQTGTMLYVPKGFAHGFLTLADDTEAFYLVSEYYSPPLYRAVRWNDPRFGIRWPFEPVVLSDKDRNQPDFDPALHWGPGEHDAGGPATGSR